MSSLDKILKPAQRFPPGYTLSGFRTVCGRAGPAGGNQDMGQDVPGLGENLRGDAENRRTPLEPHETRRVISIPRSTFRPERDEDLRVLPGSL